jgi:hypothetical protein
LACGFERAKAGENHFAEGGGIFAQHGGGELCSLRRVTGEVGAVDVVEHTRTLRGSARVVGFREDFAKRGGFLTRLLALASKLRAVPQLARLGAKLRIAHAIRKPLRRRFGCADVIAAGACFVIGGSSRRILRRLRAGAASFAGRTTELRVYRTRMGDPISWRCRSVVTTWTRRNKFIELAGVRMRVGNLNILRFRIDFQNLLVAEGEQIVDGSLAVAGIASIARR